jgi:hypothetical protein
MPEWRGKYLNDAKNTAPFLCTSWLDIGRQTAPNWAMSSLENRWNWHSDPQIGDNRTGYNLYLAMTRLGFGLLLILLLSQNYAVPAWAEETCFTASKAYRIQPLRGGPDSSDGWTIKGETFRQCVRRSEEADRELKARHPGTLYRLSLTATIGCHSPCDDQG